MQLERLNLIVKFHDELPYNLGCYAKEEDYKEPLILPLQSVSEIELLTSSLQQRCQVHAGSVFT